MHHPLKLYATSLALLVSTISIATAQPAQADSQSQRIAEPIRTIAEWDLSKKSLAIDGYDPVAYFPEGGSKPTKGKKSISHTHLGVDYRFASEKNKAAFIANPSKYEPAYGGWCAWAMSKGSKTEIDPKTYIVKDDRLFLFYKGVFGNTKKDWERGDHDTLTTQADSEWKAISGESPKPTPSP